MDEILLQVKIIRNMKNALSIDLEDWFCANNLSNVIPREKWDEQELRVVHNTKRLLDLFEKYNIKATFFVLGWIAERVPYLITQIEESGHEIATHGYSHSLITEVTPEFFDKDIEKALSVTQSCVKQKIRGFRAPSFTITKKTIWAIDILIKHGIEYDSSVFPVGFHPDYGISDAPLSVYKIKGNMVEVPLSVAEMFGKRIPCSGGGYFRLFPYCITKYLMRKCNKEGRPVIFYLHPWEIDTEQPRVKLPFLKKTRHYNNLKKTNSRLEKLLTDFEFVPIKEIIY
jgi:polysaccharide deacetylase family protein (PEP-CTERM system associated)